MNPDSAAAMLSSWEFDPLIAAVLLLAGGIYLRGWLILRSRGARHYTARRLACYGFGLAALYVALQSPLDVFAKFSLQVHMVQHLFLIIVVPPLILWSAPVLPWLVGLPPWLLDWLGPFARWRLLQALIRRMVHPVTSWLVLVVVLWLWHWPAMYQLALENPAWHQWEHASLLVASMLFWWPVMQPYPSRTAVSKWWLIPYLFLAGVQGTVLAGLITFSDRVLYANYAVVPNPWGLTALQDQQLAGALMWVPMSLALLIALVRVIGQQMSGAGVRTRTRRCGPTAANAFLVSGRGRRIRETVLSKLFRPRPLRRTIQLLFLVLAVIIVADGFWGPQVSAVNLAGVAPWIHWRGLLVITLVVGGNFFCMACPFTAFRPLVRRRFSPAGRWPRRLQTKWLAVGVFANSSARSGSSILCIRWPPRRKLPRFRQRFVPTARPRTAWPETSGWRVASCRYFYPRSPATWTARFAWIARMLVLTTTWFCSALLPGPT
jgi:cytochrome c oxidase assembly factor CtaG